MTRFLDTNVLLYSVSPNPNEGLKRDTARRLLAEHDNALSVQVLQEFYVQATRATRPRSAHARHSRCPDPGPGSVSPSKA